VDERLDVTIRTSARRTTHDKSTPSWSQLVDEAEVYEVEGLRVQVLNRATLIDLKRRRASHLDLADIEAIETLDEL
jgi:hypothetical protein